MRASILMNGRKPVNSRLPRGAGRWESPDANGNLTGVEDSSYKSGLERNRFQGPSGGENGNGQRACNGFLRRNNCQYP